MGVKHSERKSVFFYPLLFALILINFLKRILNVCRFCYSKFHCILSEDVVWYQCLPFLGY